MHIIRLLKRLDQTFISIKNHRWIKIYMPLRGFLANYSRRFYKAVSIQASEKVRIIRTIDELDELLIQLDAAQKISDDELRKLFSTFRMDFDTQISDDPYSEEYAKTQFDLYQRISGKKYSTANEKSAFDLEAALSQPFPYSTGSCETVGNHLTAIAHTIRSMHLKPGARIVEFGPGWGNMTLFLALMGFDVTAVDIEKNFCTLINKRAEKIGVKIHVVNDDFSWIEKITDPFDAVLFFECFHHSSDHFRVLKALDKAVKDDGKVYFAAEPITQTFPIPWGIRLDGESLWAIRKHGWLELGFSEEYFVQTLNKLNWIVEKHATPALPWGTVFEASKNIKTKKYSASDPLIRTNIGIKDVDGTIVSTDTAGYLIYGPYIKILPGKYTANINLVDTDTLEGKGRVEVTCRLAEVILADRKLDFEDFKETGRIRIDFDVNKQEIGVEVRLYCSEKSCVKIKTIEIEKRSDESAKG